MSLEERALNYLRASPYLGLDALSLTLGVQPPEMEAALLQLLQSRQIEAESLARPSDQEFLEQQLPEILRSQKPKGFPAILAALRERNAPDSIDTIQVRIWHARAQQKRQQEAPPSGPPAD